MENITIKNAPCIAAGIKSVPGCYSLTVVRRHVVLQPSGEITGGSTGSRVHNRHK